MIRKAILLDLDDTIFPVRSIDQTTFEPFLNDFISRLQDFYDPMVIEKIIEELWSEPVDFVTDKYSIPIEIVRESFQFFNHSDFVLNIMPYPDYKYVKKLSVQKFLVTDGITGLQTAKIEALGIGHDFDEIVINDPFEDSRSKKDIFMDLVKKYNLKQEQTFVIGDNPESEIEAGNSLNMITVRIVRNGEITQVKKANYHIKSFRDLEAII